jgi:hypothetical protein
VTDVRCLRCNQSKFGCHKPEAPHANKPTAEPCEGFANENENGVLSYNPNLPEAEGGFEGGGGSSGGGGASGTW